MLFPSGCIDKWRALAPIIGLLLAVALAGAVFSTALYDILTAWADGKQDINLWWRLVFAVGGAVVFVWTLMLLYRQKERLFDPRIRDVHEAETTPCRVLVMALSTLAKDADEAKAVAAAIRIGITPRSMVSPGRHYLDMNSARPVAGSDAGWDALDAAMGTPLFSWQQNIRAMAPHWRSGTLEHIHLILTSKAEALLPSFTTMIQGLAATAGYAAPGISVSAAVTHISTIKGWSDALEGVIAGEIRAGTSLQDICIDGTSGPGQYSAAALLTALRRDVQFSYVDTNDGVPHRYEVDLVIGSLLDTGV